ncbi:MAG: hypothetical protein KGS61_10945, partial [Verrucomicrobia bacterium]|nr:hypothetical protein [Verrucomicrobiota bacterium]
DNGIHAFTTVTTNRTGLAETRNVFTRAGQINLVRTTQTINGIVQGRVHLFYHDGRLLPDYTAMQASSVFTTEDGCPHNEIHDDAA